MSAHIDRADRLMDIHRFKEAIPFLLGALAESPDDAQSHAMLARCFLQLKQFQEAKRQVEEAIRSDPEDGYGHYIHSFVLSGLKRRTEARVAIQEALRLSPENASYLTQSANLWMAIGRNDDAILDCQQGLRIDPNHLDCGCNLAFALMSQGKSKEAEEAIQRIVTLHPDQSAVHATYGWIAVNQSRYSLAQRHFFEALRIDPENHWAETGLRESLHNNVVWRTIDAYDGMTLDTFRSMMAMLIWYCLFYAGIWMGPWHPGNNSKTTSTFGIFFTIAPLAIFVVGLLAQLIGKPLADVRLIISSRGRRLMSRTESIATLSAWCPILAGAILLVIGGTTRYRPLYALGCVLVWGSVPAALPWKYRRTTMQSLFTIMAIAYFVTGIACVFTLLPPEEQSWNFWPNAAGFHWLVAVGILLSVGLVRIFGLEKSQN